MSVEPRDRLLLEALETLQNHPGWEYVRRHIDERIIELTQTAIDRRTPEAERLLAIGGLDEMSLLAMWFTERIVTLRERTRVE